MSPWPRIFLPYAAGYFLSYLLRNANAVIAPELSRDLGLSAAGLGLLTSAYLLGFGAFQLPLGILLDRYGPRRVEASLLLVAAAGSAAFALGGTLPQLALARAAIGLGVSACLMASFKAFTLWFPADRQPSLNAAVMVAGGLGALTATTPLSLAVPVLGWRGVFAALAALAVVAAAGVASTPERDPGGSRETFREQLAALGDIARSRAFRHYAPPTTFFVGGFMALQGLWAVPFLMQVSGRSRDAAAFHLLLTTVAMMAGFLGIAVFIGGLRRRGVHPDRLLGAGMVAQLAALLGLVLGLGDSHLWWFVLGLCFAVGNLAYAVLSSQFRPAVAGRANTALNLAVFAGAFLIQWAYGAALDALGARGWPPASAHRAATGALVVLEAASLAWFVRGARLGTHPPG
ncbi:MAG TPA: MFS transporter [Anaeromyxobacteraceae bacterium]|nr:MFS transporter [Anaeromyxobacteraceae bacterium]